MGTHGWPQNDGRLREIISWLAQSLPDPSKEYNNARQKYQQGTGSWLVDGEDFQTWQDTEGSFMLLCGGTGAGKL
ncbi:ankyrin repeat-containing protein [Rutstroemia sp. NJR-2017a WRK4]|nr:ankyrin repeat-containing protein [Rutstroemia sp. NJR-2017a WRK4]